MLFHNPPPQPLAVLSRRWPPVIWKVAVAKLCTPPPKSPLFSNTSVLISVVVPASTKTPPPDDPPAPPGGTTATLLWIELSFTVNVP